jgi:hypothetical protein
MGNVARIDRGGERRGQENAGWLRRQALQLVAQLPDNEADAREILRYAEGLIEFLHRPTPA